MKESKRCTKCSQIKALTDFHPMKGKSSYRSHCKACINQASRSYRASNAERLGESERIRSKGRRGYQRKWDRANRPHKESTRPRSCLVYFKVCEETGKLFTSSRINARLSREGKLQRNRRKRLELDINKHNANVTGRLCKQCGNSFLPAYGTKLRSYCSLACQIRAYGISKVNRIRSRRSQRGGVRQ